MKNRLTVAVVPAVPRGAADQSLLGGVRLRRGGYADAGRTSMKKVDRNVALAREELASAQTSDDPARAASVRVRLARWLARRYQTGESAQVAEQAWEEAGWLSDAEIQSVARTQIRARLAMGDTEGAERWVARWRQAQPGNALVDIAAARLAARSGDVDAGLAALARVPEVFTDGAGRERRRDSAIDVESSLLARAGRRDDAIAAVRAALRAGQADVSPVVVRELGEDAVRAVLPDLSDAQWERWAQLAAADGSCPALRVLEVMNSYRPGHPAVLAAAARIAPRHGLDAATEWDARLHRYGMADLSTLVTLAGDAHARPADRAVAAALAVSDYHDERALRHLENALDQVPTQRHRELAAHLEIVAPGLVSFRQ
ncbi:MAG: tetratricopeptide repeat protein [Cellulomonas sp.]|nr:tetratricopeptide repeat protein [Cellulomonas sp.]